jgi:hypothetical protein
MWLACLSSPVYRLPRCLPRLPMDHGVQGCPPRWLETCPLRIGHRDQAGFHDLGIGDAEPLRGFLFEKQMEARPDRAETTGPGGPCAPRKNGRSM